MNHCLHPPTVSADSFVISTRVHLGIFLTVSLSMSLSVRMYLPIPTLQQLEEDMAPFREGAPALPKEALEEIDQVHLDQMNPICTL